MRSRYSAYHQRSADYIFQTYATPAKTKQSREDIAQWAQSVTFVRLEIVKSSTPQPPTDNNEGFVEFIAYYLQDKMLHLLHEKSRFVCERQQWRYIDGTIIPETAQQIGRNDACPCQSGKKFKKCHG